MNALLPLLVAVGASLTGALWLAGGVWGAIWSNRQLLQVLLLRLETVEKRLAKTDGERGQARSREVVAKKDELALELQAAVLAAAAKAPPPASRPPAARLVVEPDGTVIPDQQTLRDARAMADLFGKKSG